MCVCVCECEYVWKVPCLCICRYGEDPTPQSVMFIDFQLVTKVCMIPHGC